MFYVVWCSMTFYDVLWCYNRTITGSLPLTGSLQVLMRNRNRILSCFRGWWNEKKRTWTERELEENSKRTRKEPEKNPKRQLEQLAAMNHGQLLILFLLTTWKIRFGSTQGSWTFKCPCKCDLDGFGRKRVTCSGGRLRDIPVRDMDTKTQVRFLLTKKVLLPFYFCSTSSGSCHHGIHARTERFNHRKNLPRLRPVGRGNNSILTSTCDRRLDILARKEDPFDRLESQQDRSVERVWFQRIEWTECPELEQ